MRLFGRYAKDNFVCSSTAEYKDDEVMIYLCGDIYCQKTKNDLKEIAACFKVKRETLNKYVSGLYNLVVFDTLQKEMFIFHDEKTSPINVYYTQVKGCLYFDTSLKQLLVESGVKRSLNEECLEDFLYNGYISTNGTLIKNVKKLGPFRTLYAKDGSAKELKTEYKEGSLTEEQAKAAWKERLENAVRKCIPEQDDVCMPLSGGFDSNYIAYALGKNTDRRINAFSIGGKKGKDELPRVRENARAYGNIDLFTELTDDKSLDNYCNIVWRLEGAVYEVGLFLQYELMKLCSKHNVRTLICGECADEGMNENFYTDEEYVKDYSHKACYLTAKTHPYHFGTQMVLKKSAIMANSFGIESRYPYLDAEFMECERALGHLNGTDKSYHKSVCRELFSEQIVKNLSTTGGATECCSLFGSAADINAFMSRIEKSDFYRKYKKLINRDKHAKYKEWISRLKRRITKKLNKKNVPGAKQAAGGTSSGGVKHYLREMKLQRYFCYLYVILFDELFISGRYDSYMDNDELPIKLSDITF